jgi:soluble lytic murein transglycosylase
MKQLKAREVRVFVIILVMTLVFAVFASVAIDALYKWVYPDKYHDIVTKYSAEYSVPKELVFAVIKVESDFDENAVSSANAVGLMQMMPETFEWLTKDILREHLSAGMLYDPETNIKYGTYYLSRLYNRFGDWDTALAAYNGGEGRVSDWLDDSRYSQDGKKLIVNNIPPEYSETENYVVKVNKALSKYNNLYTEE